LEKQVRIQYALHENLQATFYTYLYLKVRGKWPIGFVWHHMRSGKAFFTYREERHFDTLFDSIEEMLAIIEEQTFAMHVSDHCRSCDYVVPCNGANTFLVTPAEQVILPEGSMSTIPTGVVDLGRQQLRLSLKGTTGRKKRKTGESALQGDTNPTLGEGIVLRDLPWTKNPDKEKQP